MWRQHHEDLVREVERGRLARQLKAARQSGFARLRSALLRGGFGNAAGGLDAGERSVGVKGEG